MTAASCRKRLVLGSREVDQRVQHLLESATERSIGQATAARIDLGTGEDDVAARSLLPARDRDRRHSAR